MNDGQRPRQHAEAPPETRSAAPLASALRDGGAIIGKSEREFQGDMGSIVAATSANSVGVAA